MNRGGIRAVAAFCYEFVVGDDWRIALGVVLALCLTGLLSLTGSQSGWWIVPAFVVAVLPWSVWRAVRRPR